MMSPFNKVSTSAMKKLKDLSGDGKVTQKDVLIGRGVINPDGTKVKSPNKLKKNSPVKSNGPEEDAEITREDIEKAQITFGLTPQQAANARVKQEERRKADAEFRLRRKNTIILQPSLRDSEKKSTKKTDEKPKSRSEEFESLNRRLNEAKVKNIEVSKGLKEIIKKDPLTRDVPKNFGVLARPVSTSEVKDPKTNATKDRTSPTSGKRLPIDAIQDRLTAAIDRGGRKAQIRKQTRTAKRTLKEEGLGGKVSKLGINPETGKSFTSAKQKQDFINKREREKEKEKKKKEENNNNVIFAGGGSPGKLIKTKNKSKMMKKSPTKKIHKGGMKMMKKKSPNMLMKKDSPKKLMKKDSSMKIMKKKSPMPLMKKKNSSMKMMKKKK